MKEKAENNFPSNVLDPEQLAGFNYLDIKPSVVGKFDLNDFKKAAAIIKDKNLKEVLVIDIGGESIKFAKAIVGNGKICINELYRFENIDKGSNYYQEIVDFKNVLDQYNNSLPIVISSAGVIDNDNISVSSNFPKLVENLQKEGGFEKIFGKKIKVINDAAAALIGGSALYVSRYPDELNSLSEFDDLQFLSIGNGGGIGVAVLIDGMMIATEASHILAHKKLLKGLKKFKPNIRLPKCGVFGRHSTCLEQISAIGQLEKLWLLIKGKKKSGKEIASLAENNDKLAQFLLKNSSLAITHIIKGVEKCFESLKFKKYIVCLHGGGFENKMLVDNIKDNLLDITIIQNNQDLEIVNSSIAGAAIAACTQD